MQKKSLIIIAVLVILFTRSVAAVEMQSPLYRIESGVLHDSIKETSTQSHKLSTTQDQITQFEFANKGYLIKAGFSYLKKTPKFSFVVDKSRIKFTTGVLKKPSLDKTKLVVWLGGIRSYQVTAIEESELKLFNRNAIIPDTKCNTGNHTCSVDIARLWNMPNRYGFGYRIEGDDSPVDFDIKNYYRPFANRKKNNRPVILMQSKNQTSDKKTAILFMKLNLGPQQIIGTYENVLTITALPGY